MECRKCNAALPEKALFCHLCGKKQVTTPRRRHAKRYCGLGNISKLSGKRQRPYLARLPATYGDRSVARPVLGTYTTYHEAETALLDALSRLDTAGTAMTLEDVYRQFCASNYYLNLKPTSQNAHTGAWHYLQPHGQAKMSAITKAQFQSVADAMQQKGLKRETIAKVRNLASLLCKEAMGLGLLSVNYGQLVQLPHADSAPQTPFSTAQLVALWSAADGGDSAAMATLVMCYTGMRPGELLGVDVGTHLHLTPTLSYFQTGSKTEAGLNRVIPILHVISSIVTALQDGRESGPLIAASGNGFYNLSNWRNRNFNPLMGRLGITGCTPYTCRHTYSNLQKRRNVDPEIMMTVMGHEDYSTTVERYHTTTEEDVARICAAVEGLTRPA